MQGQTISSRGMGKTLKKDRLFWPPKYYKGLTRKQKFQRRKEIQRFSKKAWKDPKAYVGFKTDTLGKSKSSSYTKQWKAIFPNATSLQQKADATGVPLIYIKQSYNRGMAAWRTGHRPFATEQQWGYARVHSFLLCGKTYHTTDSDLARKAKASSKSAKKWWSSKCPES
jgi:hypothetical protein